MVVAALVASLTAFSQRQDLADTFGDNAIADLPLEDLGPVGGPQTILLIGSDRRKSDKKYGYPARSDTMMLVRMNPEKPVTTVFSIPRDLRVTIPGHGIAKFNDSYSYGGPKLVVKTIKEATGLKVNHVAEVDFAGFREAVDAIDCVYTDVDRKYFNNNVGRVYGDQFAAIDVKAGYQKLCGTKALDYVRFRHYDDDLFREARQQAFLRQAKQQVGVAKLFTNADKLKKVIKHNVRTDKGLGNGANLQRLLALSAKSSGKPVYQVPIENYSTPTIGGVSYVVASEASLRKAARIFKNGPRQKGENHSSEGTTGATGSTTVKRTKRVPGLASGMIYAKDAGRNQAVIAGFRTKLPVFYPTAMIANSSYQDQSTRAYVMTTTDGKRVSAYRIVSKLGNSNGDYYGIQGVNWDDPPILKNPSETRRIKGRDYLLYYEGGKLGMVAFKRNGASYWVQNTLTRKLTEKQMISLATSLRLRN